MATYRDLPDTRIYGGEGIRNELLMGQLGVAGGGGARAAQMGFMPWDQLEGISDFRVLRGSSPDDWYQAGVFNQQGGGGDATTAIDADALAAFLDSKGYKIGTWEGGRGQDWRWLEDAQGNYVSGFEPKNYYTDDRTAAILGMLALGGAGASAIGAGVGVSGAGGVGAGYGTGSIAFGDAAAAGLGSTAAGAGAGVGAAEGVGTGGATTATEAGTGSLIDAALAEEIAAAGTLAPEGVGALVTPTVEAGTLGGGMLAGGAGVVPSGVGWEGIGSKLVDFAKANPKLAAQLVGLTAGLFKKDDGGGTGPGGIGGLPNPQAGMTTTQAPKFQREYVAPPAGYRPGFDPEHKYFTGIGTVGTGS